MSDTKYKIIKTIPSDAPFGYVNWLNISFLTPQKHEDTKYLDIVGFKVHNGYTIEEMADKDAVLIKNRNKMHDICPIELGKLYSWDNIDKAETMEYDDKRLNDLEVKRRENADKLKLMREQFRNEHATVKFAPDRKKTEIQDRLRENLYKKGKITKRELEMMQEQDKPLKDVQAEAAERDRLDAAALAAFETDYLDLDEEVPLRFGCISIFTPKTIGGLNEPCFKVRGLFQTQEELSDRLNQLKRLYPDDRIFTFRVGQWTVYSDNQKLSGDQLLQQLNYAMKCHLDRMASEEDKFNERKTGLKTEAENEAKLRKMANLKEKRKEKRAARQAKKAAEANPPSDSDLIDQETISTPPVSNPAPGFDRFAYAESSKAAVSSETNDEIRSLMDYLNDDELLGKFMADDQAANSDPSTRPERAEISLN